MGASTQVPVRLGPIGLHRGLMGTIWAMCEFQAGRSGVMPTFNEL